jgi:hypothetical protein
MAEQTTEKTHVYFEWQCATLMYAYDVLEPLHRLDEDAIARRRQKVEEEVYELFVKTVPQNYRNDPTKDFSADIVMDLTKATLRKAAEIASVRL